MLGEGNRNSFTRDRGVMSGHHDIREPVKQLLLRGILVDRSRSKHKATNKQIVSLVHDLVAGSNVVH